MPPLVPSCTAARLMDCATPTLVVSCTAARRQASATYPLSVECDTCPCHSIFHSHHDLSLITWPANLHTTSFHKYKPMRKWNGRNGSYQRGDKKTKKTKKQKNKKTKKKQKINIANHIAYSYSYSYSCSHSPYVISAPIVETNKRIRDIHRGLLNHWYFQSPSFPPLPFHSLTLFARYCRESCCVRTLRRAPLRDDLVGAIGQRKRMKGHLKGIAHDSSFLFLLSFLSFTIPSFSRLADIYTEPANQTL